MKHFFNPVNPLIMLIMVLTIIQTNAQDICGSQIIGAKTEADASQRAAASLAQAINAKASYRSIWTEIIDGRESSQKDTTVAITESKLLNLQAAKYAKGKGAEGYFAKACMSAKDAAKPYLDSLRYLAGALIEKSCDNASETLKIIAGLESVIMPLNQMDVSLQKEYEKVLAECGKRGIYLEMKEIILGSKSEVIKRKLEELLSQNNCRVEPKAKGSGFTLKAEAKDCKHKPNDPFYNCGSCVTIDLADGKDKKGGFKASLTEMASWFDKKTACEKAAEDAAPKIWEKVKDKISEACN